MDVLRVAAAMRGGLSAVCATCRRYWDGRERGLPEPTCTAPGPCGSPIAGLAFPYYSGPMTDFLQWCFVCGDRAKYGLQVGSSTRRVGCCAIHLEMVHRLRAVDAPARAPVGVRSDHADVPVEQLFKRHKPSFAETLAAANTYLDEQDGKKP